MRPSFPHRFVADRFFKLKLHFKKVLDLIVSTKEISVYENPSNCAIEIKWFICNVILAMSLHLIAKEQYQKILTEFLKPSPSDKSLN